MNPCAFQFIAVLRDEFADLQLDAFLRIASRDADKFDVGRRPLLYWIRYVVGPPPCPFVSWDLSRLKKLDICNLVPQAREPSCLGVGNLFASETCSTGFIWIVFTLSWRVGELVSWLALSQSHVECFAFCVTQEREGHTKGIPPGILLTRILCILHRMHDPIFRVWAVCSRRVGSRNGPRFPPR